jgi:hypothetical protein
MVDLIFMVMDAEVNFVVAVRVESRVAVFVREKARPKARSSGS